MSRNHAKGDVGTATSGWEGQKNAGPFRKLPSEGQARTGAYKELVEAGHDLVELHALMASLVHQLGRLAKSAISIALRMMPGTVCLCKRYPRLILEKQPTDPP